MPANTPILRPGDAQSWFGQPTGLRGAPPPDPRAVPALALAAAAAEPMPAAPRWPAARLAAATALWGAGFLGPGGAPETLRLCKPLDLRPNAELMLLGGGLGGPAEAIYDGTGATVESFEADPELASLAESRLAARFPAGKPRLHARGWNRHAPAFAARSARHAISLEASRGASLPPILDGLSHALRPHGQIVLTELVANGPPPDSDREFAAWCRLENRLPSLPTAGAITAELERQRFRINTQEDISDRHVAATLSGWRDAVKAMAAGPKPSAAAASVFVTEAELWLLRVRLMRRLGIRLVRWHATWAA